MKNPHKYKNSPIEIQKMMKGQELEDELYKIIESAVGFTAQHVIHRINEHNEIIAEVYLIIYKKDKEGQQVKKYRLMNMIKQGNGPQVFNYVKQVTKSVIRDLVQKDSIDKNMNMSLTAWEDGNESSDIYTIRDFRKQLKAIGENSKKLKSIEKYSSSKQWKSVIKLRNNEKLTVSESADITRVMYKVVGYQHNFTE